MKKIFYNILAIAVLLVLATSCEDVLDQNAVDTNKE